MTNSLNIPYSLRARIGAWLLMAMVLFTVVPFNLFHTHEEETLSLQVNQTEDHNSCHHEFHIAEEQEFCFLCHFAFLPTYKKVSNTSIDNELFSKSVENETYYDAQYTFLSAYSILNKGSPLA